MGEWQQTTGRQAITAIVAGYEVAMRVGAGLGTEALERGWHPRGGVNTLAAGVAAAKLLGLDQPKQYSAVMGLASNRASGLTGASYFHDAWYTLSANACLNGVLSALEAQAGFTAGDVALEAEHGGYIPAIVNEPRWDRIIEGLGEEYEIMKITQKIHASSGATHAAIDGALQLVSENSLIPDEVDRIVIRGFRSMVERLGTPFPSNLVHAGMSIPFLVAVAVCDQEAGLKQLQSLGGGRDQVRRIQERTQLVLDPDLDALCPRYLGATTEIATLDGRFFETTVLTPRGDPENPLTNEQLVEKFRTLASHKMSEPLLNEVCRTVNRLDDVSDLGELMRLLRS